MLHKLTFTSEKKTHILKGLYNKGLLKSPKKTLSLYAISFLMAVSVLLPIVNVVFMSSNAGAVPAESMTLLQKAQSFTYMNGLRKCIQDGNGHLSSNLGPDRVRLNEDNAAKGDWFHTNLSYNIVDFDPYRRSASWLDPNVNDTGIDYGQSSCNAIVKASSSFWGYSDILSMLCDVAPPDSEGARANKSSCRSGSGDFGADQITGSAASNRLFDAVQKRGYTQSTWPTTRMDKYNGYPGQYLVYKAAFDGGCKPKESANPRPEFAYTIKVVDAAGGINEVRYEGVQFETKRYVYTATDLSEINETCRLIEARVNEYAPAFAAYTIANKEEQNTPPPAGICQTDPQAVGCASPTTGSGQPSCVVEGIGWIVCPVMNFMGGVVDAAYGWVADLLKVQPLLTTGNTSGAYNAWSVMRSIANIAFVIVFLIIIFSQLTSLGVSNYGVKKMLPRLVIAAILVNISFWICAAAVDLSNIIGSSMVSIFNSIGGNIKPPTGVNEFATGEGAWGSWGALIALVLASAVVYYAMLSALIPALLAAFVAILTVFLVLALRQALIILLIVIAPLAFVAYLLPNTEEWFTKWRKLLLTLLLMFPIIAAIFGASSLASQIVMNSANGNIIVQIMGAAISIIPLAITPVIMKAAGGILNRFAGIVNNAEKGPIDRLRKVGDSYHQSQKSRRDALAFSGKNQLGRGAFVRWRARRGSIANGRQSEANYANSEYIADKIQSSQSFQNSVAGGSNNIFGTAATSEGKQRALANAIGTEAKLRADEISASHVVIKSAQLTQPELRKVSEGESVSKIITRADGSKSILNIDGSSTAVKAAAIRSVVEANDVHQINKLWDESRDWHDEKGSRLRETFADSLQSSSHRPAYFGQGAIAGLRSSTEDDKHGNIESVIESALKSNAYSADKIASADKDELAAVDQVRRVTTNVSQEQHQRFRENVHNALTDERINVRIGKNRENIEKIEKNIPIPPLT